MHKEPPHLSSLFHKKRTGTSDLPVLTMKKKVIISSAPHNGSISLPTSTTVKISTATWKRKYFSRNSTPLTNSGFRMFEKATSQKWISRKQWERAEGFGLVNWQDDHYVYYYQSISKGEGKLMIKLKFCHELGYYQSISKSEGG